MVPDKIIFVIPGFRHVPTQKAYKKIAQILKGEGYHPILIKIPWKKTTISENTEYFLKEYRQKLSRLDKKYKKKKTYILGFSYGAMIAFIASTKISVSGLILCSLSPYFKEDITKVKENLLSNLTKRRYQDFLKLHCKTLAKKIKAKKILLLYGSNEPKSLIRRVHGAFAYIVSSKKYLIPIKKTEHDISNKRYLQTIHQIAKNLT